jgi:hypothetical protein
LKSINRDWETGKAYIYPSPKMTKYGMWAGLNVLLAVPLSRNMSKDMIFQYSNLHEVYFFFLQKMQGNVNINNKMLSLVFHRVVKVVNIAKKKKIIIR